MKNVKLEGNMIVAKGVRVGGLKHFPPKFPCFVIKQNDGKILMTYSYKELDAYEDEQYVKYNRVNHFDYQVVDVSGREFMIAYDGNESRIFVKIKFSEVGKPIDSVYKSLGCFVYTDEEEAEKEIREKGWC
jgi:hypothetical protein